MTWYVQSMGDVLGPYSDAQLKQQACDDRIQFDTQVALSAQGPWVPASKVKGLFSPNPAVEELAVAAQSAGQAARGHAGEVNNISRTHYELPPQPTASAQKNEDRRRYKVLTQKDKWFAGKFDPERLEDAINFYAGEGWSVRGVSTTLYAGVGGKREEVLVVLEKASC